MIRRANLATSMTSLEMKYVTYRHLASETIAHLEPYNWTRIVNSKKPPMIPYIYQ